MTEDTAFIYARVSKKLHARVKEEADKQNLSMTQYVINALEASTKSVRIPLNSVKYHTSEAGYEIEIPADWWQTLVDKEDADD